MPATGVDPRPSEIPSFSSRNSWAAVAFQYWTRKARGKTVGLNLTEDELVLYREWIENNRKLDRLVKEMRHLSSRALALITGRQAP